jgi:hypothetical protein
MGRNTPETGMDSWILAPILFSKRSEDLQRDLERSVEVEDGVVDHVNQLQLQELRVGVERVRPEFPPRQR